MSGSTDRASQDDVQPGLTYTQGGHRGASHPLELQGPRGWNCRGRGGPKRTNCRACLAGYLELPGIDPPEEPEEQGRQKHRTLSENTG
jgi:hypothetical protein